jgi:hypothetical protein
MAEHNYTLSYDDGVKGFPSFYSYQPDWMIGMNNYFYTFKNGNLYRHNVNEIRNNFYDVQYNSTIQSVFNDIALENKLFKTINLEGDDTWSATLRTDIQDSGFIQADWFEKKEQVYYAFVRNSGSIPAASSEYPLRSLNGIGRSTSVVGSLDTINFPISFKIKNIMSIGDMLYFTLPPQYNEPKLAGQILSITHDPMNGINQVIIDTSTPGAVPITVQDAYFLFIKNAIAESHGVLGHYCVFDITNTNTNKINLFAVESEVMKSYP